MHVTKNRWQPQPGVYPFAPWKLFVCFFFRVYVEVKDQLLKHWTVFNQKHIIPKRLTSPYLFRTTLGFFFILPKYGIREFKAKNFELATPILVCLRPKEGLYASGLTKEHSIHAFSNFSNLILYLNIWCWHSWQCQEGLLPQTRKPLQ